MKNTFNKTILTVVTVLLANTAWAQAESGSGGSFVAYSLIAIAVLVFFFIVVQVSDNLLVIEAKQSGAAATGANLSLFPSRNELFASSVPEHLKDKKLVTLKRGHDILLEGEARREVFPAGSVTTYAAQPRNFIGLSPIPKMVVEEGAEVKAGDILFFDKKQPEVKWAAPVSGEVIAIKRGAKRAITEVIILADKEIKYRELSPVDPETASRQELANFLQEAGAWPLIRQRPFHTVPSVDEAPRDIFISTFDTAPLAPDLSFVIQGKEAAFQKGLDVLGKMTDGKVYLGLDGRSGAELSPAFTDAKGVESVYYRGKHPAGNVGVQIHHVNPLRAGDKVWTLGVQEVATLGQLFLEKRYDVERVIALAGAELKEPHYVRTYLGANIGSLAKDKLAKSHIRYISGDVLSGQRKDEDQFLDFFDDQLTVVQEGDDFELFGWLLPSINTPSISKTFPSAFLPNMKFRAETNTHGEKRAFVVTGNYERVLPMDIHPQELMKSILIGDFERMEGLGVLELVEEDVALCEFVCVSKQPVQQILRQGLDMMREQG